ncbi:hypothetical protein ACN27J_18900 [Solwaraspora sp. WMMB762]|uniref:hypothetical protein n=1 Tax=Solwaraspora sp. WMMB762 TaxID=3404120 RepID=UPI003B9666FE
MEEVEQLLPSPVFAVLVAVVVALCVLVSALRERWLGETATVDPVVVGADRAAPGAATRAVPAALLRLARAVAAVLLALAFTILLVLTLVRFAVLADSPPVAPGAPAAPAPAGPGETAAVDDGALR